MPNVLRDANADPEAIRAAGIVDGNAHASESDLWASDTETLVSEEAADPDREGGSASDIAESDIDPSDYALRFRLDTYRPSHGGAYAAPGRDGPNHPDGSLKGDIAAALQQAHNDTVPARVLNGPHPAEAALDAVFANLSSGTYADTAAPSVLAFALSRHYPIKRLVSSYLDDADADVLRALGVAERHGYRVSLAQLEFSHFGNPQKRNLHVSQEWTMPDDTSGTIAGVRAIRGRAYAFREPADGERVFATHTEMTLRDDCVLNGDIFWTVDPDSCASHLGATHGLGAYYDLENKFLRTAVVLWRTLDQGSVMLEYSGAEEIVRHLALIASLPPTAIGLLRTDVVDPVLDDAILLLEEPETAWRRLRKRDRRAHLANIAQRIAACRGRDDIVARLT
ncbi:hypothetical protein EXIGLDRAFT_717070 [Exidia glandulosa HHB12029]|uniref:Uncharacterized protein n=1 Tax=Exidia glandulosa HHB12029 TaxID=1314781 RepID=A0A165IJ00_EXIGL|nr:hypothetical protein EXIGLDRAFT_717070 [Exidia glandulosa HHB12029]